MNSGSIRRMQKREKKDVKGLPHLSYFGFNHTSDNSSPMKLG